jgi:glutathione S-transferase
MVRLYHKGNAICAQKVRICLAEKGVAWESKIPDVRDPEYLALNPNGYLPTFIDNGKIIPESRIICEYINDAFAGPALLPVNAYGRARASLWTKQIDDFFHLSVFTLTFASGLHARILKWTPEEIEKILPFEVTKRDRAYDMIEKGFDSKFIGIAVKRFAKMTEDMECALAASTWLAGETYTLADVDYTPYLQRITDLGLGFLLEDKPNLRRWFAQVKARASFAEVIENWVTQDVLAAAENADGLEGSALFLKKRSKKLGAGIDKP